ncbi:hypothetical protein WOLCODRAFT_163482 [Wolfiporia cocos MD-104 SS10]|uniref:F-box domain-containing protein n=1 Tax=Wolfiporia cocos (strain MD-104) TaxID=742152 RepID=A0A2H3JIP3_WOLCO|nr:hypothetical protein WOLCODRAFT_163482 [Wolfiporia cocos MD-104 SS10]
MTAAFGTSMDFWSKEVRTNLLPMITDLLEQAVNLRRLFLPQAAHLLAECPRLRLSFARLTKLEELTLEHGGNESVASLCQVHCGLQHLNLSGRWYEDQISGGELFAAMGHFANLHTLILTNVEESGGVVRAALARQQWPTVRNLRLFRCNDPLPVFAHAFPNVRSLYVWMMGLRPHRSETCWAELDYVNGTPRDLKLWLRTCPVRHLELDTTLDNADMDDYVDSVAVLLSLKPVFLTLSVERTFNRVLVV